MKLSNEFKIIFKLIEIYDNRYCLNCKQMKKLSEFNKNQQLFKECKNEIMKNYIHNKNSLRNSVRQIIVKRDLN